MINRNGLILFCLMCVLMVGVTLPVLAKCFLWEVDTPGGKCYLLGSVHMLKAEHYPLDKNIEEAFIKSDVLAVEADLTSLKGGVLGLMKKGMYMGDETLEGNLSAETFGKLKEYLKPLGADISLYAKFKPWFLAMNMEAMALQRLGFQPQYGIDMHFMMRARGEKEIVELEGVDFQLNLFNNLSKEENELFLLTALTEADSLSEKIDGLVAAWQSGDVKAMETYFNSMVEKEAKLLKFKEQLLDRRNERMVTNILPLFKSGKTVMVLVGAGHMVGPKGLVQLLQDKGYAVRQL